MVADVSTMSLLPHWPQTMASSGYRTWQEGQIFIIDLGSNPIQ